MIPKIIHYCWVGPRPMGDLSRRCVESWQKHLPDYHLKFWNDQNAPMEHPFMKRMYESGRFGFVPDYLRFWALEKFGGVYLDCDVELLGSLDPYLGEDTFLSFMCTQNRIRKNPPGRAPIRAVAGGFLQIRFCVLAKDISMFSCKYGSRESNSSTSQSR